MMTYVLCMYGARNQHGIFEYILILTFCKAILIYCTIMDLFLVSFGYIYVLHYLPYMHTART